MEVQNILINLKAIQEVKIHEILRYQGSNILHFVKILEQLIQVWQNWAYIQQAST